MNRFSPGGVVCASWSLVLSGSANAGFPCLLSLLLLALPTVASAAPIFTADVSSSFISATACSAPPYNLADPTIPGAVGITCGDNTAVGSAGAVSNVGHVGAFANATALANPLGTSVSFFQGVASWQGDLLVTGGPGAPVATLSANFALSANLGGLGADLTQSEFSFGIGLSGNIPAGGAQGVFDLSATHSTQGDTCTSIPVGFCGTGLPGHFVTPTFNVFVGVPFTLLFDVSADVLALGDGASGSVDAFHSLDLILNQPVFNFSDPGFTAQGGACIVDNIFVCSTDGSGTSPVPEPSTLALFGAGLFGLGTIRRRWKTRA